MWLKYKYKMWIHNCWKTHKRFWKVKIMKSFSPSHSKRSIEFLWLELGSPGLTFIWLRLALFNDSDILSFRFDKMAFWLRNTWPQFDYFAIWQFLTRWRGTNIRYENSKRGTAEKINHNGRGSIQLKIFIKSHMNGRYKLWPYQMVYTICMAQMIWTIWYMWETAEKLIIESW